MFYTGTRFYTGQKNAQQALDLGPLLNEILAEIETAKYKQNHESMWNNFIQYTDSAADATSYIQRPDSCYPQCSSIIGINAATSKFDAAKQYLEQLIQINQ